MSWLFSRALVAAYSPGSCSAGEPSAQLNVMPTPQPFWRIGRTKGTDKPAFLSPSQFGLTCERLTAGHGAALLMSYLAAFHAKTSASREASRDLTANDPACGWKWPASFAKYDPRLHGWKTRQISLIADSTECSPTWPRSGSMRDGECLAHATLARGTNANASGSKLPTLTVCGNYNRKGASPTSGDGLATALRKLQTLTASDGKGEAGSSGRRGGENLRTAVRHMPTLAASDWKGRSGAGHLSRHGMKRLSDAMPNGGPLNPVWCEWFMGFPLRWTELEGSATRKSQRSRPARGSDYRSNAA